MLPCVEVRGVVLRMERCVAPTTELPHQAVAASWIPLVVPAMKQLVDIYLYHFYIYG